MRVRTVFAWMAGAATGAASVWLLDPDAGQQRRRHALRAAWDRGRDVDWVALAGRGSGAARELSRRAAEGYREGVGAG